MQVARDVTYTRAAPANGSDAPLASHRYKPRERRAILLLNQSATNTLARVFEEGTATFGRLVDGRQFARVFTIPSWNTVECFSYNVLGLDHGLVQEPQQRI